MHVRDDILYEGPNGLRINHEALRPTGRLAGNMYCHTDDVYELVRPSTFQKRNLQVASRTERVRCRRRPFNCESRLTAKSGAGQRGRVRYQAGPGLRLFGELEQLEHVAVGVL